MRVKENALKAKMASEWDGIQRTMFWRQFQELKAKKLESVVTALLLEGNTHEKDVLLKGQRKGILAVDFILRDMGNELEKFRGQPETSGPEENLI